MKIDEILKYYEKKNKNIKVPKLKERLSWRKDILLRNKKLIELRLKRTHED